MSLALEDLHALCSRLSEIGIHVVTQEPLARHTSLRIGGPADLFCEVHSVGHLLAAVEAAVDAAIPYTVLGGGSNVLVSDKGIRGLVIKNKSLGWLLQSGRPVEEQFFTLPPKVKQDVPGQQSGWLLVAGGEPIARLARRLARCGIAGLHWAAGLPGTVASAVVNNAGAFGSDIASCVGRVAILCRSGRWLADPEALEMRYRHSILKGNRDTVVVSAEFAVHRGDPDALMSFIAETDTFRRERQPRRPSAGSVFKNPEGYPAGYLIEQAGLKGTRVGRAQVSPVHANFIVNTGGASARDVLMLIRLVREKVFSAFGIELELEIELLGEW